MSRSEARGRIIARALGGAWRAAPPATEISAEELLAVTPQMLRTGSAPLAFWRNRSLAATAPALAALHDTWRFHVLHGAVFEERLPIALTHLLAVGVEPLLAKGWAMARQYPRPGLRPYGDLDLYVRPSEYGTARAAVDSMPGIAVDLHRGLPELDDRDHEAVFARAVDESVGGVKVRVLAPEDHLRLLCRHFLRHGASRPLWLCDVALLVETRGSRFDWDLALSGRGSRRDAVLATVALAGALLGADVAGTPATGPLPPWVVRTTLEQWAEGTGHREPLATYLSRPTALWAELRRHWPNAIEALAALDAPFGRGPRLPFQLAHLAHRAARFGLSLVRGLSRERPTILNMRRLA